MKRCKQCHYKATADSLMHLQHNVHDRYANTNTNSYSSPWWDAYLNTPLWQGVFREWGRGGERRKWGGGGEVERQGEETYGRLITCLASSKDVCSRLISFSYWSLILSTSWSWEATSSFRAPFSAVSSLSRLLSTSSCSSLARRTSCMSTFSCIMSCGKQGAVWRLLITAESAESRPELTVITVLKD